MAGIVLGNQTIGGLLEVGDDVRTGPAPDDFVTIITLWPRAGYVKLEVELFDQTREIIRVRNTDAVVILPPWEAPTDDDETPEVEAS